MDEKNTRDLQELEPFEEPVETDPTEAVEEGEPYFPPTDPVVRTGRGGRVGFALPAEHKPQRLLGAGLADRAGDGDDLRG